MKPFRAVVFGAILFLTTLASLAQSGSGPELVLCMGKDSLVIPFEGAGNINSYALGATLKLRNGAADRLTIAKKNGENFENLATLYDLPVGYELVLGSVIAAPKPDEVFRMELVVGAQTLTQDFKAVKVEVPPCEQEKPTDPPYVDELRRLVKLVNAPTASTLEEYKENAVVEVNAATGSVTPAERSKIRRGHYLIVKVTNGLIYSCSVEAIREGGGIDRFPCQQPTVTAATRESNSGKEPREVVPFGTPLDQLVALQRFTTESEKVSAIRKAIAAEIKADPLAVFSQNLPVRASYRETVIFLRLIPTQQAGIANQNSAVSGLRDVTLTMNAQKWGSEPGVGFVLAFPGTDTFKYADTDDPTKKKIVRASSSDANPMPFAFLNLYAWEHSQWAWTLGVGLESESQKAAFALGGTYRFSGHAQVTLGVALVPVKELPDGLKNGSIVPVADTTLQSLDYGQEASLFIGIGWRSGGQDDLRRSSESEPAKR